MRFLPPGQAPAHQALLDAAEAAGHDRQALRRLLWLVNAHPDLVAHAQTLRNMVAYLESDLCAAQGLAWAGHWQDDIPRWLALCRWVAANRVKLSGLNGLGAFDTQPQRDTDNPLLKKGVTRHGVIGALWSRHQQSPQYPPPADGHHRAAECYFQLQTHLLISCLESRHRLSLSDPEHGLAFYETYVGDQEQPVPLGPTAAVGLAIREFSRVEYSLVVEQLPVGCPTPEFHTHLTDARISLSGLSANRKADALRYLSAIRRYFGQFRSLAAGAIPSRKRRQRRGGAGGGGHPLRPGYVHFRGVKGVTLLNLYPPPDDEDVPDLRSSPAFVDLDGEFDDDELKVEASGLAPGEAREEVFRLYHPEELGGRLARARYQRLAVEMQAQLLPFSYSRLTATEALTLHRHLAATLDGYLLEQPRNVQLARQRAMAALILQVMWYLGQPLEAAKDLRVVWHIGTEPNEEALAGTPRPTLVLVAAARGDWAGTRAGGFALPALSPNYKTELADALDALDRPRCNAFLLPDVLGLGARLIEFLRREARPNDHVFGIEPETASTAVKQLVSSCGMARLSADKVALALPHILLAHSGDLSLGWCVTADRSSADEPRMHYTRYAVPALQRAYIRAARRLARDLDIRVRWCAVPPWASSEDAPSVGARFVIRRAKLRDLIADIVDQIRTPDRTPFERDGILAYHHAYVLYVWLFQSLHTTVRAVSRPNGLYHAWEAQHGQIRPLTANLSDKDGRYTDKSRLVSVGARLAEQFAHYRLHVRWLRKRLGLRWVWDQTDRLDAPLLIVADDMRLEPVTPGWIAEQLAHLGHQHERSWPIPPNFHRAFLRTELLERGCPAEAVDAFLGHANVGESPFGRFSSFDYGVHRPALERALGAIHEDLDLVPVPSRLVAHPTRCATA